MLKSQSFGPAMMSVPGVTRLRFSAVQAASPVVEVVAWVVVVSPAVVVVSAPSAQAATSIVKTVTITTYLPNRLGRVRICSPYLLNRRELSSARERPFDCLVTGWDRPALREALGVLRHIVGAGPVRYPPGRDDSHPAGLIILHGLNDLGPDVHHERPIPGARPLGCGVTPTPQYSP